MRVSMISLGCSKNLVNSEQMLWLLKNAGHELCDDTISADAVVVNTCGFLESARAEAVEQIIELGTQGSKLIIVAGCMSERHKREILDEMPEVNGVVGCGSFDNIVEALESAARGEKPELYGDINAPVSETPRVLGTPPYTAYLKLAEGCDNRCAYCLIPNLRGSFRSRPIEAVVSEAARLVENGAEELTLVAQDTTRYGLDIYGKRVLPELIEKLCAINGLHWLRLHYLYPGDVTPELINAVAEQPKCVKYFDIPIQHCNDRLLKLMRRRGDKAGLLKMVADIRARIPGAVLRTSLIVGLPGETDAEFEELCEFLRETNWERAGVFEYSAEDGTSAAEMPLQIDDDTKRKRRELVEDIQREVMDEFNARQMGKTIEVLCEGYDRVAGFYYGRSAYDAPEVDGKVFFTSKSAVKAGSFVNVEINDTEGCDLMGETT